MNHLPELIRQADQAAEAALAASENAERVRDALCETLADWLVSEALEGRVHPETYLGLEYDPDDDEEPQDGESYYIGNHYIGHAMKRRGIWGVTEPCSQPDCEMHADGIERGCFDMDEPTARFLATVSCGRSAGVWLEVYAR